MGFRPLSFVRASYWELNLPSSWYGLASNTVCLNSSERRFFSVPRVLKSSLELSGVPLCISSSSTSCCIGPLPKRLLRSEIVSDTTSCVADLRLFSCVKVIPRRDTRRCNESSPIQASGRSLSNPSLNSVNVGRRACCFSNRSQLAFISES